jgi:hypothetical protein
MSFKHGLVSCVKIDNIKKLSESHFFLDKIGIKQEHITARLIKTS